MTRLPAVYDGNNALIMRFEYADAGMPFAMTAGSGTYFLAYDQVGSLRVVADGSGAVVKRIDYDSFGNVFNDSAPGFAVPFGFAGGLYDKDTKLVRFGFRDYDPDTGRWTAKDPIGFGGGDSDLYGYCVNDPVNWIDPGGLYSHWLIPNSVIESKMLEYAKEYGIGIAPEISKDFAREVREAATKDQVRELEKLQNQINKLPCISETGDTRVIDPAYNQKYSDMFDKQKQIAKDIIQKVLDKHPEWKNKIDLGGYK